MASLTQWMWAWANSGRLWQTGKLACCSSCGHKESDTTDNNNPKGGLAQEVLLLIAYLSVFQHATNQGCVSLTDFTKGLKVTKKSVERKKLKIHCQLCFLSLSRRKNYTLHRKSLYWHTPTPGLSLVPRMENKLSLHLSLVWSHHYSGTLATLRWYSIIRNGLANKLLKMFFWVSCNHLKTRRFYVQT